MLAAHPAFQTCACGEDIIAWKNKIVLVSYFDGLCATGNDKWDRWEHSCLIVTCEILGFVSRRTSAKAFGRDVFVDPEGKFGDRRRSDTVGVVTINHADWRMGVVSFKTPAAPWKTSKFGGVWSQG